MNIIVYVGVIMVLFFFVLMLLNLSRENELCGFMLMKIVLFIVVGVLFIVIIVVVKDVNMVMLDFFEVFKNIGLVENLG